MSNYIERYWRDAKPEDAIAEPPMVARFRSSREDTWHIGSLMGVKRENSYPWYSIKLGFHKQCQVYDAPDPGEDWRLIDPNTEPLKEGDEFMVSFDRESGWVRIEVVPSNWSLMCFYRRRIEQPKPKPKYIPFTWEDRKELRGRWIAWKEENGLAFESYVDHFGENRDGTLWFNGRDAKYLLMNAIFVDTGEPVGKKTLE